MIISNNYLYKRPVMKGSKTLIVATVFATSAFAIQNNENLQPTDKYYVSPENAETMLKSLQSSANKKRPPLSSIAYFNGGTAKEETHDAHPPCFADEKQYEEIQISLINKWRSSWKRKELTTFNSLLLNKKVESNFIAELGIVDQKISDNINLYKWNKSQKGSFSDYLAKFKVIEDIDLITMKIGSPRSSRDKQLNMNKAELHVYLDVRGVTLDGKKRHDRGPIGVNVENISGKWKIAQIQDWGVETLIGSKPTFEEVTVKSGVDRIPAYRRLEAIRRGGYAIAVGDYNGDGINDLYVGAHGAGKLLKGKKDGSYEEAKDNGLENETLVKTAVFADFNNDGKADLLLVRFSGLTRVEEKLRTDVIIYQNKGNGKFVRKGEILGDSVRNETAMPAAVGDFNGDGLLDFYVGYPGNKDFTVFGTVEKRGAIKEQGVYINQGNFKFLTKEKFENYQDEKFASVTDHQRIFPHSAMALDFDLDGDVDIMVIDDRGNISPAYRNDGKGNFTQAGRHIGVMNQGFGMGMAAADINNDGNLDMVMTNVNFTQKYRMDKSCWANWDDEIFQVRDHGLKLYQGVKKGSFAESTGLQGLDYAGEGLAGLEFIDYNNDGYQDLYVTNGLWSGTDKDEDLASTYIMSHLAKEEWILRDHRGNRPQSEIMDVLSGFKGSIVGKTNAKSRLHLAGFQRNRLFRNNGDGSFTEVGYLEGVDSIADGYIIAKSDIDNDGSIDLILRNGDPGTKEINFAPVQVFKNKNGGKSIRLKLVGSGSNRDAIGAQVTMKTKETSQLQLLVANNGTAQSELVVHFGLGNAKKADEITIRWPNGDVSIMKDVKPGFMKVEQLGTKLSIVNR
jgi:hypothetical protein